jgi:hypothetical protein
MLVDVTTPAPRAGVEVSSAPSSSIAASQKRGGEKINGPPPQPSLPAVRHSGTDRLGRSPQGARIRMHEEDACDGVPTCLSVAPCSGPSRPSPAGGREGRPALTAPVRDAPNNRRPGRRNGRPRRSNFGSRTMLTATCRASSSVSKLAALPRGCSLPPSYTTTRDVVSIAAAEAPLTSSISWRQASFVS